MTALLLMVLSMAPADVVGELPVIARLAEPAGTPFVIRGRLSKARGEQMTALARAVQRDVTRRFLSGESQAANPPVELCLFETSAEYERFVERLLDGRPSPSPLGFFEPSLRVVVANLGLSVGNLRHEMAHAIVGDDFSSIPSWLTEGVGALYGTAVQQKDGTFRFVANYRLKDLRAAKKAGTLPTLDELTASSASDIYGERAMMFYGLSRHLLLYLDRQGTLTACFARLRAARSAEAQRGVLEAYIDYPKFMKWTETLTIGE